MRLLFLLLILIFCNAIVALAQQPIPFKPIKDDSIQLDVIKKAIRDNYLQDSSAASGENKKYFREFYKGRLDFINQMFTDKELIYTAETNKYLTGLVNEIF